MQFFSLGQGTVSPRNIVSYNSKLLSVQSLSVPAIRNCWKLLQHPGTAWNNAPWEHSLVPRSEVASSGQTFKPTSHGASTVLGRDSPLGRALVLDRAKIIAE